MIRQLVLTLEKIPKWYGIIIILLYCILFAEYISTIFNLVPFDKTIANFHFMFLKINYFTTLFISIIIWLVLSFLFHLTALLFDGSSSFSRFLFTSSYFLVIQVFVSVICIFALDKIPVLDFENFMYEMQNNSTIQFAKYLINFSFIVYYLIIIILIHYIYQIKYIYAFLSVAIPLLSIWGITELFKLI